MVEINWDAAAAVATLLVVAFFFLLWCFDSLYNDGGPPEDGWGVYTDEEHIKRLNERLVKKREERIANNLTTV